MKNELVKLEDQSLSKAVVDILKEDIRTAAEGMDFRPPRYTIEHKGLKFLSSADNKGQDTITGVIVLKQKTRGIWKEGEKAPECSSLDGIMGKEKLVEEERLCSTCPKNQWGSHGEKGKACKEMRRVLIVENTDDYFPVVLTIPPTSIRIFDEFLSGLYHKKIYPIMTNIKFSLERAEGGGFKYAKIKMELAEPLTMAQIEKVGALKERFKQKFENLNVETEETEAPGTDNPDDFSFGGDDPNNEHLPV